VNYKSSILVELISEERDP